jgi:nucleoid-associated protein YgaU
MAKKQQVSESELKSNQADTPQSAEAQDAPEVVSETGNDRQSQLATILIGLLIIGSGLLLYNYFQNSTTPPTTQTTVDQQDGNQSVSPTPSVAASQIQKPSATPTTAPSPQPTKVATSQTTNDQSRYTVMSGDTLWSIAEKVYGSGYDWNKIDQANKLTRNAQGHPNLESGMVLTIPGKESLAQKPTDPRPTTVADTQSKDKIAAGLSTVNETPQTALRTYTIQSGDTLWAIAEQFYGSGEKWLSLYNDPRNNLGRLPSGTPLIHAGNTIIIP